MKTRIVHGTLLGALCLSLTAPGARAQETPPVAVEPPALPLIEKPRARYLMVRNVRAGIVGWQLDSTQNAEPVELRNSRKAESGVLPAVQLVKPGKIFLPQGVQRIVPIDPQNALLVYGTEAGTSRLQELLKAIDLPMPQIELEVRYVLIEPENVKQLHLLEKPRQPELGPFTISSVSADTLNQLSEAIRRKQAQVLMAPRVVSFSGFAVEARRYSEAPASLGYADGGETREIAGIAGTNLNASVGIGFTARTTANADGTLSMVVAPGRIVQLVTPAMRAYGMPWTGGSEQERRLRETEVREDYLLQYGLDGIQSIPNFKDGETIVLSGCDSRMVTGLGPAPKKYSNLLVFITATRVKHLGDDVDLNMQ